MLFRATEPLMLHVSPAEGEASKTMPVPIVNCGMGIALLELLPHLTEEGGLDALWALLESWLPDEALDVLGSMAQAEAADAIRLVILGQHAETPSMKSDSEPASNPWRRALSVYCATYQLDPAEVLEQDFRVFLELSDEAKAERARGLLDAAFAASAPHAGKEGQKHWKRLEGLAAGKGLGTRQERAVRRARRKQREEADGLTKKERIKRQFEEQQKVRGKE